MTKMTRIGRRAALAGSAAAIGALSATAAIGAAGILVGCGSSSSSDSASSSTATTATGCPTLTKGTLTIGTDNPAYPPWFQGTPKAGSTWKVGDPTSGEGYEAAVAYAVAAKMGYKKDQVTWQVTPFSQSYAPGDKPFDFFINQVSYTPQRAKNVDFSPSYYTVAQAVVALKGTPIAKATSIPDLQPYTLGAQVGTTAYTAIKDQIQPNQDPRVYDNQNDVVSALKAKQVDGIVVDLPTAFYVTAAQVPNSVIVGQLPPPQGTQEHFGLVMAKGSKVSACVDAAVTALQQDGTLDKLQQQWLSKAAGAPVLP